jgi:hypothetical protein
VPRWPSPTPEAWKGVSVSVTLRIVMQSYELVLAGNVSPVFVATLDGFEIVGTLDGDTHLSGSVESQGQLYDLLAVVGASDIDLVSLRLMTDWAGVGIESVATHHDGRGVQTGE